MSNDAKPMDIPQPRPPFVLIHQVLFTWNNPWESPFARQTVRYSGAAVDLLATIAKTKDIGVRNTQVYKYSNGINGIYVGKELTPMQAEEISRHLEFLRKEYDNLSEDDKTRLHLVTPSEKITPDFLYRRFDLVLTEKFQLPARLEKFLPLLRQDVYSLMYNSQLNPSSL